MVTYKEEAVDAARVAVNRAKGYGSAGPNGEPMTILDPPTVMTAEDSQSRTLALAAIDAAEPFIRKEVEDRLLSDEALFAVACKRIGIDHEEKQGCFDTERHARELIEAALASQEVEIRG